MSPRPQPPKLLVNDAVFIDFDGTLVDIASSPEAVKVGPQVIKVLDRLDQILDRAVAIVSGRPLSQLDRFLRPHRGAAAGIHGLERRTASGVIFRAEAPPSIQAARIQLDAFAEATPGVWIEDKGVSLAVHCRAAPHQADRCQQEAEDVVVRSGNGLKTMQGKMVVEILPLGGDKGQSIRRFLEEQPFRGRRPIFLGDDLPDEHGFDVVNALGGLSIHVGRPAQTGACYGLPDVTAVLEWLAGTTNKVSLDQANARLRVG